MWKRLLIIAAAICAYFVKDAWRNHQQDQRLAEQLRQQMPGMYAMSERTLLNSEWAYSGPLGEMTMRFEPKGKLTVEAEGTTKTGRYEVIEGAGVNIQFPDSEKMLGAVFRTTTDELFGVSPRWTATRKP